MTTTEILLGYPYLKAKKLLKRTEYFSERQHKLYQQKILSGLLRYASEKIPFYKERLGHLGKNISEENCMEMLHEFPFITKSIIRKHLNDLSNARSPRAQRATTGGSSASPMPFYMDRFATRQREKAFMWNQWARVGYVPGERIASFTGRVPKNNKLVEYSRLFNTYVFSSFNIAPEKINEITSILNHIHPLYLHGYPSTLFTLAKIIQKHNQVLSFKPRAIFCGSEKIFSHQRNLLEDVFNTRTYSWYGHSEYCVLGGECEYSHCYHLFPQYGYVEFLPIDAYHESGKKLYEIVATGFNNWVMPFIRYRTGDYAVLTDKPCRCGRQYPLIEEVVGRTHEFIVDKEKNLISVSALTSLFEKEAFIDEVSIIQYVPGKFILAVSPSYAPSASVIDDLIARISWATNGRLTPSVEFVKEIPKAPSGKRCLVQQHIDLTSYLV